MPRERKSMRKIREVLRLKWKFALSHRQIQNAVRLGYGTVCNYLQRAKLEGLSWEQVENLSDGALEERLFPRLPARQSGERVLPEWAAVHQEFKKKGVTL